MIHHYNAVICRYNEIGTKGRNKIQFEEQLGYGLIRALLGIGRVFVQYEHGRLFLRPPEKRAEFSEEELSVIREKCRTVAGLSSFSPGFMIPREFDAIRQCLQTTFPLFCEEFLAGRTAANAPTYAMRARRADKTFPMTCEDIERTFAEELLRNYPQFRIDLKNPEFRVDVEIRPNQAFVSYETLPGPGGLPAGSAGNVLCLLSGGFDSPVACYEAIRRGCTSDFLTFHSEPYTPPAYLTKVALLAKKINEYQRRGRLVAINLLPAQKAIRDNCQSKYRTVLYRRMMLRLACIVAEKLGAKALVTGDNIGQVASQTLENMSVINQVSQLLVLRPLLTFDKLQTMAIAREIGTFDLSIEQIPDSCTVFAPDNPCTNSESSVIQTEEALLDIPALLQECLASAVFINPTTQSQHPL